MMVLHDGGALDSVVLLLLLLHEGATMVEPLIVGGDEHATMVLHDGGALDSVVLLLLLLHEADGRSERVGARQRRRGVLETTLA
jgi:hypothetical protein